jgi:S-adenosylmethionine hydrolase
MRKKSPSASREVVSPDSPIITLLSDFGSTDPYVGSMKGVILSISKKATIVDITHSVAKFDVLEGGFILAAAVPYFPPGTIHVAVVDPGVGGRRKALLVKTKGYYLVGPDNGILMVAASQDRVEKVIEITNPRYGLSQVSSTFHGRDVFCAVAAHLANGVSIAEFGSETNDYVKLEFPKPDITGQTISGEVVHVDNFGNIVTNIKFTDMAEVGFERNTMITVTIGSVTERMKYGRIYGDVAVGESLALIGSAGFLEISVNQDNAASIHGAKKGTRVSISRCH